LESAVNWSRPDWPPRELALKIAKGMICTATLGNILGVKRLVVNDGIARRIRNLHHDGRRHVHDDGFGQALNVRGRADGPDAN